MTSTNEGPERTALPFGGIQPHRQGRPQERQGHPGDVTLLVDGKKSVRERSGDHADPTRPRRPHARRRGQRFLGDIRYDPPLGYTGTIHRVIVDVSGDDVEDYEADNEDRPREAVDERQQHCAWWPFRRACSSWFSASGSPRSSPICGTFSKGRDSCRVFAGGRRADAGTGRVHGKVFELRPEVESRLSPWHFHLFHRCYLGARARPAVRRRTVWAWWCWPCCRSR